MKTFSVHVHPRHHETLKSEVAKLPQATINPDGKTGTLTDPDQGGTLGFELSGEHIHFTTDNDDADIPALQARLEREMQDIINATHA